MDLTQEIDKELKLLFKNVKWVKLFNSLPSLTKKNYSRTVTHQIFGIEKIKEELRERLGVKPIFFALHVMSICGRLATPYNCLESYLLLIYQLVTGKTIRQMHDYMAKSTFYDNYRQVWVDHYKEMDKEITSLLSTLFSTPKLRVLSAKKNNPAQFSSITMFCDGHDTRINFGSFHQIIGIKEKRDFYSFKLQQPGFRTQFAYDVNNFFIYLSPSLPARLNTDQKMFKKYRIDKIMSKYDCMMMDGLYKGTHTKLIEIDNEEGGELKECNFRFPLRKIRNVDFSLGEQKFNDQFGGLRSKIESAFAELGNTFHRFDSNNNLKCSPEVANLQLKFCSLLLNFRTIDIDIEFKLLFNSWLTPNIDFGEEFIELEDQERVFQENQLELEMNLLQQKLIQPIEHDQPLFEQDNIVEDEDYDEGSDLPNFSIVPIRISRTIAINTSVRRSRRKRRDDEEIIFNQEDTSTTVRRSERIANKRFKH